MIRLLFMFLAWILLEGCTAVDAVRPSPCERACAALAAVGCREGSPTPAGHSCAEVCQSTESIPGLDLPTACLAKAKTKSEAKACGVVCW